MDQLQGMRVFARVAELRLFCPRRRYPGPVAGHGLELRGAARETPGHPPASPHHAQGQRSRRRARSTSSTASASWPRSQAADDELRLARDRPQGKLRVDVPVAFGKYLLLPAIAALHAALSRDRARGAFQRPLRGSRGRTRRRRRARGQGAHARSDREAYLRTSRLVTCASPTYLARAGIPRTPEDLRKHRLIGYLRGGRRGRPNGSSSTATARARVKLPMALSSTPSKPLIALRARGPGNLQQFRPAGRRIHRRGPPRGAAAGVFLRRAATQRGLSARHPASGQGARVRGIRGRAACAITRRACAAELQNQRPPEVGRSRAGAAGSAAGRRSRETRTSRCARARAAGSPARSPRRAA